MTSPSSHFFARDQLGFVRVAAVTPETRVADVDFNTSAVITALHQAARRGCRLALFPELCITGYSCADLFNQAILLHEARAALPRIAEAADKAGIAAVVGLPLEVDGRLYNCAAFLCGGRVIGVVPKSFLPTTNEYYEERWFTAALRAARQTVLFDGQATPFGPDMLFEADNVPSCVIGIELCEDLWAVNPPSGAMALAGATVLLNPSASDEVLGKADYRRDLVRQQSARCLAAYVYAAAGPGESTTDVVFGGHSMIAENGALLAEAERFRFDTQVIVADVDVQRLVAERLRNSSFSAAGGAHDFRLVSFTLPDPLAGAEPPDLLRPLAQMPFVPADRARRAYHCREIFSIQSTGLAKRLKHVGVKTVTLGISGGLDSTLALLVTIKAFDTLGLNRAGIVAVTMPGFGTTARTRDNAQRLAEQVGVTLRLIPITDAVRQHFKDIGHDETIHDVTYENAQARERTQILMDLANKLGGLVVGTGDLSELALGWATFNGDHMSMYHVNAGVPKTLVRYLIEWAADAEFSGETSAILRDIIAMPITPELLPLGEGGALQQETEATIGPYLLHDFFLFYTLRYGFAPRKVFYLARRAFDGVYAPREILRWMKVFYARFFSQQFKRSAMPDGPKVGTVALSPRGDWRMPSDAAGALWIAELEAIVDHNQNI
ncbi:MAG: NAD(+) synthase [Anaerolineae bacterium]|nr:NAD(+) synthase [Thermoflexales bacterium]MDW8407429.1 NAD(+) synthase [Anaerolineae bacterium]